MARHTLKSLLDSIVLLEKELSAVTEINDTLKNTIDSKTSSHNYNIKEKNKEIHQLQRHIGFVHTQRDRLVGFIEGRESLTNPEVDVMDASYHQPNNTKVNRLERFISECTLRFISDDNKSNLTVMNDEFRGRY